MDRHDRSAGAPSSEHGGDIDRAVADFDVDRLGRLEVCLRKQRGNLLGLGKQRCRRQLFSGHVDEGAS
jgi:hypothetical protein